MLSAVPSPLKSQEYDVALVELLVKVTAKSGVAEVGLALKLATGAAAGVATEMVLVVLLLPSGPVTVNTTG